MNMYMLPTQLPTDRMLLQKTQTLFGFSSLQHGADPTKKNRDGNTPLDLVKEGDTDIQDLLRGDAALLDAAKKGCLARVQKLCTPENINCRDTQGRNSTPLHLAGKHHKCIQISFPYLGI